MTCTLLWRAERGARIWKQDTHTEFLFEHLLGHVILQDQGEDGRLI
jgi:hypothetical protein